MEASSRFETFQILGWPPGLLGEIYAVTAALELPDQTYRGEFFLFTQRPKPKLTHGAILIDGRNAPPDLLKVDLDLAIEESQRQAENALIDRLSERTEEIQRPDLLGLNVSLTKCKGRPFVSCWIRNLFHAEIHQAAELTQIEPLKRYLKAITKIAYSASGS